MFVASSPSRTDLGECVVDLQSLEVNETEWP